VSAGALAVNTNQTTVAVPVPFGGTLANLQVRVSSSIGSGTSRSYVFTVIQNGNPTGVTCTVTSPTATSCTDNLHSVVFAAGDTISLQAVPSGNPTQRTATWSVSIG
jgi:hypothetical protein